ncbi:MAG: LmeA family phospholipid-binding protein [Actinomycetota bacterium]|nr:LmeA family phospholipid-binding protein [Actinomycetota bacterium]
MLPRILGVGLALVVLVGVVLVVGSYTFLPPIVEERFGRAVQDRLGLETAPEVSLSSEPPPSLLVGEFESGRLVLEGLDFEGVRPDRTIVDLDPFSLDVLGSLGSGTFETEGPLSGSLRMELSEREVARLANTNLRGPEVESMRLEPGRTTVRIETRVMGVDVPVSVVGDLAREGQTLAFEPRRVAAFGVPLPERLSDRLVSQAGFEYPLEDLPYDTEVSDVRTEEGRGVVEGRIGRIPVGGTGG